MNVGDIFNRQNKDNGQVRVPSIEVQGDELRVDDQPQDQPQQGDRQYRLPKTKWF